MSEFREISELILGDVVRVVAENEEIVRDAYERMMNYAGVAKREGLIALPAEAERISQEILLRDEVKEMIDFIVGGMDAQFFKELMTIRFFTKHDFSPIESLLFLLYARCLLIIQADFPESYIKLLFQAMGYVI